MKPSKPRLKRYTVELEYLLPLYQTVVVTVPAGTAIKKICALAQEKGESWETGGNPSYDSASATYVSAIVRGQHENCYEDGVRCVAIPYEESKEKVVLEDLLALRMDELPNAVRDLCKSPACRRVLRRSRAALRKLGVFV